jgi:IclR family transcriptional regulator, KDG regulon repressor
MFVRENGKAAPSNSMVPAVVKAFRLLELLSESKEPLGISELSRRLGMGKSTIHGLVTTLQSFGAVEAADESKRYRIGSGLHVLAMRSASRSDVRTAAKPGLERLAALTEQTSFLGIPSGDYVTILDLVHGKPAMSVSAPIGSTIPLLAGAVGKAVLAGWDNKHRKEYLRGRQLPRFTAKTITDPAAYGRAVDETIASGVALDVDEYVDGMRAAAAPVISSGNQLVGVIWIAAFARHIDDQALRNAAEAVAAEARAIGSAL